MALFDIYSRTLSGGVPTYTFLDQEDAVDEDTAVTAYAETNNIGEGIRLFATDAGVFTEYVVTISRTYGADPVV